MILPATLLSAMTGCSDAEAVSVPRSVQTSPANPELELVSAEEQATLQSELVETVQTNLIPGEVRTPFGIDHCPPCGMG